MINGMYLTRNISDDTSQTISFESQLFPIFARINRVVKNFSHTFLLISIRNLVFKRERIET